MVYIKRIEIRGFKSYKELTMVEPFSPQHNVIGSCFIRFSTLCCAGDYGNQTPMCNWPFYCVYVCRGLIVAFSLRSG
jgi:hypothetical protein